MRHCIQVLSFLISIYTLNSCQKENAKQSWNDSEFSPSLKENPSFKKLNLEKEIYTSIFEDYDSLAKKSTNSILLTGKNLEYDSTINYHEGFKCTAHFNSDTLSIDIGTSNGFSGLGFLIKYKDKKFFTETYRFTDVIIEGIPEPTQKIIYQKLKLDKENYIIGDSIFGQIEFKSIETNHEGVETEYFGKGDFRAIITKQNY